MWRIQNAFYSIKSDMQKGSEQLKIFKIKSEHMHTQIVSMFSN